MTSIATNAKNDIFVGPDGNLAMVMALPAAQQDCEHAMKAQLAEMVLNLQRGVPTDQTVWSNWNPVQFEAYARRVLLSVPNVKSVNSFAITRTGDIASYVTVIDTDFGVTTISGVISNG